MTATDGWWKETRMAGSPDLAAEGREAQDRQLWRGRAGPEKISFALCGAETKSLSQWKLKMDNMGHLFHPLATRPTFPSNVISFLVLFGQRYDCSSSFV